MRAWIVAVMLAFAALLAVPPGHGAVAAPIDASAQNRRDAYAADLGARHNHLRDRAHDRYYLGRPHYYAPAPFFLYFPVTADWRDPLRW